MNAQQSSLTQHLHVALASHPDVGVVQEGVHHVPTEAGRHAPSILLLTEVHVSVRPLHCNRQTPSLQTPLLQQTHPFTAKNTPLQPLTTTDSPHHCNRQTPSLQLTHPFTATNTPLHCNKQTPSLQQTHPFIADPFTATNTPLHYNKHTPSLQTPSLQHTPSLPQTVQTLSVSHVCCN